MAEPPVEVALPATPAGRAGPGRSVVLGVAGGIAAYKAVDLLRRLTEAGHHVVVMPTESALRFVGEPTWAALSHNPVAVDVWSSAETVPHVRLGRQADLVVVAPATADLLARAAHGMADDLLTNTLLTARCPVLFAPAMHTEMWQHPATVENVATLRRRGSVVLEPAYGRLTGTDTGQGRLPEPDEIARLAELLLLRPDALPADLVGRRVLITAGGTREPLDPVRFLGNRSSGKQGYELAAVAAARGAQVTLVAANVDRPAPAGTEVIAVETAEQLRAATLTAAKAADVIVMAAAVADFRPASQRESKIKKAGGVPDAVELTANPDVLSELVAERAEGRLDAPVIVGFAAETGDDEGDVLAHGRAKLARKRCDLLVVNAVSQTLVFGRPDTTAVILNATTEIEIPLGPKAFLAAALWDAVVSKLTG